jgi:Domain of unknown function (DUF4189)
MKLNLKVISLFMVAAGVAVGAPATAATYIGAIAYSPSTGATGVSVNAPSATQAKALAIASCRKADCAVDFTFSQCGAVAKGKRGIATAKAATRRDADIQALAAAGSSSRVLISACNR